MAKVIETDVVTVDSVFAHVPEAILVAKPDARVIDANPAASLFVGRKENFEKDHRRREPHRYRSHMIRFFRFSPSRLALVYIALSVLAIALFAIPLWYAWRVNISTFRAYVQGEDLQRLVDIFDREGAKGLVTAMESQVRSLPADQIMVLADASKLRLAGNLTAWPAEVPDAPGTYGLVIDLGGGSTMRVVASHVRLPGGYHLLMGRESVRFESLVERFWYGITGAMVIVVVLGAVIGWLSHRALLSEVNEISRTASAIVEGDLSRRVATRGGSDELDTLARTVNGMLEQLARQNVQLEGEIAVRRQAHLWFLESMDQVNRAIQATNDLEQMMSDVLDAVIAIFNCDRAWLVYPCDPEATSWKVPMTSSAGISGPLRPGT